MKLKKAGLITSRCLGHDGSSHVWTLEKPGFETIAAKLPPLTERGFKSEFPSHDLVASAFHQGEWFFETPVGAKVISEQQLRRYEEEFLEVDDGLLSSLHRPDGVSQIDGKWFSFEAELSMKRTSDYELIGEYYHGRGFEKVFWLLNKKSQAQKLSAIMNNPRCERPLHEFYLYKDFVRDSWRARSCLSADERSCIATKLLQTYGNGSTESYSHRLLDVRKYPVNQSSCKIFKIGDFLD